MCTAFTNLEMFDCTQSFLPNTRYMLKRRLAARSSSLCGWQVSSHERYDCDLSYSILLSFLVFHGGSGSTKEEIQTGVNNGVVKMNVDTGLCYLTNSYLRFLTTA